MCQKLIKNVFIVLLFLTCLSTIYSESLFDQGEEHFLHDRLKESIPLLLSSLEVNPSNEQAYLYLAYSYEVLDQLENAKNILVKGLDHASSKKYQLLFNLGNITYKLKEFDSAETYYSLALLHNSRLSSVYLNRANTRVALARYDSALDDYTAFLQLEPENPQNDQIRQLMNLLNEQIVVEKQRAEDEESRKQEELARQQQLLQNVLSSLGSARDETRHIGAGQEGIIDFDIEDDLED